jgi:hypothetical protein
MGRSSAASAPASACRDLITGRDIQETKDVQPECLPLFEDTGSHPESTRNAKYTKSSSCSGSPGYAIVHSQEKGTRTYVHVHAVVGDTKVVPDIFIATACTRRSQGCRSKDGR